MPRIPCGGVFLASTQTVSSTAVPGASTPGVRHRSEAVNVDHLQFVERHLNRFAVVMRLEEFAPVGGRATSGCNRWRLERFAQAIREGSCERGF